MSDEPLAPRTSSSGRRLSRHKKETKEPNPEYKPVRLARTGSLGERRHHRAASMLPGTLPLSSAASQDVEMGSLSTPTSPLPKPKDASSTDDRLPPHHGNNTNTNTSTSTSAENLTTSSGTHHNTEATMGALASVTLVLTSSSKKLKPSVGPALQRSKSDETCCSSSSSTGSTTSSMTITNSSGSSSENIRFKTTATASKNDRSRYTDYRDGLASRNTRPFDDVNFCFVCKAEFELDTSLPLIMNNNTDSSSPNDELLGPVNPGSTCGRLLASGQLITLVAAAGFKLQLDRGSLPIYRQVFLCSACHSDMLSPRSARNNTWPQPSGNNISLLGRALPYFS